MKHRTLPSLSLRARLLKWRVIGLALAALSRAVVRLEKTGGPGGWASACQLEVMVRAALHELSGELCETQAHHTPDTEDAQITLEHLKQIQVALLALALFARHLQTQLAGASAGRFCAPAYSGTRMFLVARAHITDVPFLDSS